MGAQPPANLHSFHTNSRECVGIVPHNPLHSHEYKINHPDRPAGSQPAVVGLLSTNYAIDHDTVSSDFGTDNGTDNGAGSNNSACPSV
jgi:hypothetical protein